MSYDKNEFLNSSNPYRSENSQFYEKGRPTIYVEGYDDKLFYDKYLDFYFEEMIIKPRIYFSKSKKNVLIELKNNINPNNKYIVDSDYDTTDELIEKGAIVTTGYSMENFFFYFDSTNNNLRHILKFVYEKLSDRMISFDDFYNDFDSNLKKYYDEKIVFFAYMKTLHELRKKWSKDVKELFYDELDFQKRIYDEINELNENDKFWVEYSLDKNIKYLKDANYMKIRGHNIFDFMINYLENNSHIVKGINMKEFILTSSNNIIVPQSFKEQFD